MTLHNGKSCLSSPQARPLAEQERLRRLESLVDELIKDQPNSEQVEKMMTELGLPFGNDPIYQLNSVLKAMHGFSVGDRSNEGIADAKAQTGQIA